MIILRRHAEKKKKKKKKKQCQWVLSMEPGSNLLWLIYLFAISFTGTNESISLVSSPTCTSKAARIVGTNGSRTAVTVVSRALIDI